jgi:ribulose-phosphate 3-epimerase
MIEILPAILENSFAAIQEKLARLDRITERVQLDIADGIFVPETSWHELARLSEFGSHIKFDLHLMVENPAQWLERAASSSVFRITFHQEAAGDIRRTIELIRKVRKEVGIALNLDTPVASLYDILQEIDIVLLLAVIPGAQGRQFNERVLAKIKELRTHSPNVKIGVDGGVSPAVAPAISAAGANVLVCGSWLWEQEDLGDAIRQLQG